MAAEDYGIKVSLPGVDVFAATPEQCAVHSAYPPLKSRLGRSPSHQATVNVNFTAPMPNGNVNTVWSMNHGYGRKVSNIAFLNIVNPDTGGFGLASIGATFLAYVDVTETQLRIRVQDTNWSDPTFRWITSSSSMSVTFFVFAEDG